MKYSRRGFGPILAIQVVKDAKEAIAQANDSRSRSREYLDEGQARGLALAAELRAGAVMVNDAISYSESRRRARRCGASGWGRTHGKAGCSNGTNEIY